MNPGQILLLIFGIFVGGSFLFFLLFVLWARFVWKKGQEAVKTFAHGTDQNPVVLDGTSLNYNGAPRTQPIVSSHINTSQTKRGATKVSSRFRNAVRHSYGNVGGSYHYTDVYFLDGIDDIPPGFTDVGGVVIGPDGTRYDYDGNPLDSNVGSAEFFSPASGSDFENDNVVILPATEPLQNVGSAEFFAPQGDTGSDFAQPGRNSDFDDTPSYSAPDPVSSPEPRSESSTTNVSAIDYPSPSSSESSAPDYSSSAGSTDYSSSSDTSSSSDFGSSDSGGGGGDY